MDAWWKQYSFGGTGSKSKPSQNQKKSATGKADKNNLKTTVKNSSNGSQVNQYTMTFLNTNGGTTTLTKDPSNKYIQKAISRPYTDLNESMLAAQMLCYSDSSNKAGIRFVYIYTTTSGKSELNLKYIICLNTDTSPISFLKSEDGTEYAFFHMQQVAESHI